MLHRDDRRASKTTWGDRSRSAKSRRARFSLEGLEERSLMSVAGLNASIQHAHNLMLAQQAIHRLQLRAELIASRHDGASTPVVTGDPTVSASVAAAAKRTRKPPTHAAPTLDVAFKYQSATDLRGDATIGYLAVGFHQDVNIASLYTPGSVQLSYLPFNAPQGAKATPVTTATIQYNAGNKAIVVTPGNFIYNGHVQPNGTYYLGIYGATSTAGGHLTAPVFMSYTDHSGWGLPGHFPITAASLPGNAPTIPNDPYRTGTPIFNGPGSGVIILDQYEQLDPASVNGGTVQLFKVTNSGWAGAVRVPATVTYDAEIPSIYVIPSVALTVGNYRIAEFNTVNFAGSRQTVPVYLDFFVPQNDVPPGGNPNSAPNVNWTFPSDKSIVTVTDLSSIGFNVPIDPSTLTPKSILLQQNVNGNWVTVPHAISYNAGTYVAYVTPTQGIKSQGTQYRLRVNADLANQKPIKGTNGQAMGSTRDFTFTYNAPKAPFPPLIDAVHWESFPNPGSTVQFYPAAFQVTLNKWNGYRGGSINNKTFQIFAVNASGQIIGHAINGSGEQVVWNPRSSYAIITLPNVALGDGRYVIVANAANGQPGVGVVDLAGNVQKSAYRPQPFTITGTGRPQTIG